MSLREKLQMTLDTESATHNRMEGQSRCSHKYLLLQVWCGLLTVAMVIMAALFSSTKSKSTEVKDGEDVDDDDFFSQEEVSTLKPDSVSPTDGTFVAPYTSGSSPSYITLTKILDNTDWAHSHQCDGCSLVLRNNSIHFKEAGVYFLYAQVNFSKLPQPDQKSKCVRLKRNAIEGRGEKTLVKGMFPNPTEGSVWVANIVSLKEDDSVSIEITGVFRNEDTFWGAFQLQ